MPSARCATRTARCAPSPAPPGSSSSRRRDAARSVPPMSFATIDYSVADHVATITLDRPDRLNAFTVRMQQELCAAVDRVDADEDVRAVVVTGHGRGFCAGADLGG